jgi:type I restriction enzyme S subunit
MEESFIKFDARGVANHHQQHSPSIMASVTTFKSAITRIRDILRGPGMSITGMDSMRHICLYLLSRYMTKEKVASMRVPDEFAWETLIETAQTKNGGVQNALDCFYHPETDCLVRHFDRLFGTDKFSFDIKNPQKHKEILEILNGVVMSDVDCQMDILGWVYELHLKTGSSSAGRDLGQFFTDRFICEYMTELCAPGFKHKGVPESVCDPSMGTGGFLTSFIKYYKKHHANTPIDWAIQQKEIHGNDTDPRVAGVARLNLFMETGGNCSTNLLTHDSLYGDLTQTGYDVILANMPFGLKGIKHAECCERVKKLKIRGTSSEPLFLQLMMVSLNHGGRCAVVVPDGMLVNSTGLHNETRKYLLDHFELKRVIKMRGKFFMNTGIQPSILFFENTGKPTTAVEFWDVIKSVNGSIEETMVLSVPRERFDASCSLDVRRYQEVKEVDNSAGYPMVKLSSVLQLVSGKANTERSAGHPIPYYDSNGIIGYVLEPLYNGEYIITARNLSIGAVHYVNGPFYPSDHTINFTTLDQSVLNNRFFYYWLLLNNKVLKDLSSGVKPGIRKSAVAEIQMPLPPLPIQQEIVATFDRIYQPGTTELADTLKLTHQAMDLVLAQPNGATRDPIVETQRLMRKSAQMVADVKTQMVADVKAQMVAIMKSVGSRGFPICTVSEKCSMAIGGTPLRSRSEYYENGTHVWVSVSELSNNIIVDSKEYINDEGVRHSNVKLVKNGSVLMSFKLSIGKCAIAGVDLYTNEAIVAFYSKDESVLLNKYLYYYLSTRDFSDSGKGSLGAGSMNKGSLSEVTMPLPPLDFQRALIIRLDALQSQLTAFENLGKQAEDNAHFILESYLGTTNGSAKLFEVVPNVEECTEETCCDSSSSMNEVIYPDESVASVAAASSEVKVVKRKKPTVGTPKK